MDVYYENFDEHISLMKPPVLIQNIIWGGLYVDLEGELLGLNHNTGEKCVFQFFKKP